MDKTIVTAIRACASALEQLARAIEEQGHVDEAENSVSGWPDFMPTRLAAQYCGFKTSAGLRKAHFDGRVSPAGRRGNTASWSWARSELDRFMRGAPRPSRTPPPTPSPQPQTTGKERPKRQVRRRCSPETERALERIREIARGG